MSDNFIRKHEIDPLLLIIGIIFFIGFIILGIRMCVKHDIEDPKYVIMVTKIIQKENNKCMKSLAQYRIDGIVEKTRLNYDYGRGRFNVYIRLRKKLTDKELIELKKVSCKYFAIIDQGEIILLLAHTIINSEYIIDGDRLIKEVGADSIRVFDENNKYKFSVNFTSAFPN